LKFKIFILLSLKSKLVNQILYCKQASYDYETICLNFCSISLSIYIIITYLKFWRQRKTLTHMFQYRAMIAAAANVADPIMIYEAPSSIGGTVPSPPPPPPELLPPLSPPPLLLSPPLSTPLSMKNSSPQPVSLLE